MFELKAVAAGGRFVKS